MIELSQSTIYIRLKEYKKKLNVSSVELSTIYAVLKEFFCDNKHKIKAYKNEAEIHNDVSTLICTMVGVKVDLIDSLGCIKYGKERYILNLKSIFLKLIDIRHNAQ